MQEINQNLKSIIEKLLQIKSPHYDYQFLMNKGNFADAGIKIEELLLTNNLPEHRLAWILCQFAWSQVPVVTLVSPLEEILPQIQDQPKLFEFAGGVYLEVGIALVKQEKYRLAVVILEGAFNFIQQLELSKSEKTEVLKLLINTFQDEIAKAERRREDKQYIEELNNKLETFKKTVIKDNQLPETTPKAQAGSGKLSKKEKKNFSAKSLLQDFDTKDKKDSELKNKLEKQEFSPSSKKHAKFKIQNHKSRSCFGILFAGLCLCVLIYLGVQKLVVLGKTTTTETETDGLKLEMTAGLKNNLALPALEPLRERHDTNAALGAIALKKVEDRLQQGGKIIELVTKANKTNEPDQVTVRHGNYQQPNNNNNNNNNTEAVPRYEQYYGNYGEQVNNRLNQKDFDQTPNLDPKAASGRKIDVIESGERRIDMTGLHRDRDGRIYGEPANTIEVNKMVNGGVRKNVKSFYVEQYNPPVDYQTIVNVTVLSSPSAISYSISELPKGADIKVSAYMGPWLEVVSYKGRKGYIYTQDAIKK
ncbi:MAG: hypothetical protein LBE20_07195 [Deltaproteobacteria bacterium]|jgi:hypothetical protein|nr:hypothetical protein [Deltaproteobacteria bacterium]